MEYHESKPEWHTLAPTYGGVRFIYMIPLKYYIYEDMGKILGCLVNMVSLGERFKRLSSRIYFKHGTF
jgi:hypothetical protein